MATERQIVYLQQLVIDLGFSRHSRNVYIREYIGKSVEETGLEGLNGGRGARRYQLLQGDEVWV